MHKVLVVEDEKLVRSLVVYDVLKSGMNFQWIMEAESAEEALITIENSKPDIVITDIMMGEKSGIDLIREINISHPEIVSIIICGHSEFKFAQEAVELNAISYILKPVSLVELTRALQKASLRILNQTTACYIAAKNDILQKKLEDSNLHKELYGFLNGFHVDNDILLTSLFPPDAKYFQTAVLHINGGWEKSDNYEKEQGDIKLLRYGAINIITELENGYGIAFSDLEATQKIVMIMASNAQTVDQAEHELARRTRTLHEKTAKNLSIKLYVGVSNLYESLSVATIETAKRALDLRFCFVSEQRGRTFNYSQVAANEHLLELDTKLYSTYLDSGDIFDAIKLVRNGFEQCKGENALNLRLVYIEVMCILARCCFKNGTSIFTILGSETLNGSILDQLETLDEIIDRLCQTITAAIGEWAGKSENTSDILERIKRYIDEYFCDSSLCTNDLALKFCISLGYLSACYKKAYSTTISKYIIELRMEYAKELLLTTDLPIHAIAQNSGFNHLSYFMRVFKNHFGCTCGQIREDSNLT